jgi:ankyrin repeat protein
MGIDAPLRLAIWNSHIEIIKLLLDRYPDIQAANRTAFHWAVEYCQVDSMAMLLDRGVTVNGENDSWLVQAALNGSTAVVKFLLDHGADIHGVNDAALFFAADCRHDETAELLIEYGNFRTEAPGLALIAYSTMGKTKDVEILIRQSADLHTSDDAALRSAAWNNHSDVISLLVGHYEIFELRAIQSTTEAINLLEAIHIEIQKRMNLAAKKALKNTPEFEL